MKTQTEFLKHFEKLARRHSAEQVFDDYVTMSVCALSQQQMEKEYLSIVAKYNTEEVKLFPEMYGLMVIGMENMHDFLGHIYMEIRSKYKGSAMGQYFTPEPICKLMDSITNNGTNYNSKVNDPACGSGRLLLANAMNSKPFERLTKRYYGQDLDHLCIKMTLINCCLNGLLGEFYHMNTLSLKYYNMYSITLKNGIPCITKISSHIVANYNEQVENKENDNTTEGGGQLSMF